MTANQYLISIGRIKAAYEGLTSKEKKIADYILNNVDDIVGKSAADLAEVTDTSPATIFRFCKTIGFDGFLDFKLSLENSTLDSSVKLLQLEEGDSTSMIMQKVLMFNKNSIEDMSRHINQESLDNMIELINKAQRVVILGDGGSGCSSRVAFDVFLKMGMRCEYVHDPFLELMVISQLTENDLLFVILNSGRSINTIQNCQLAKDMGIPIVGIVGSVNTPISKYLDVEVLSGGTTLDNFCDSISARISELLIISIIHSMLMMRKKDKLKERHIDRTRIMELKRYSIKKK